MRQIGMQAKYRKRDASMKAMIVAGGWVEDSFLRQYQENEAYQVTFAVDRGLGFFVRSGQVPDYIVGDFDSVEKGVLSPFLSGTDGKTRIIRLNPEKDDTDTQHALEMAFDLGCEEIHLFGASGSRIDHLLGNIQLLGLGLKKGVDCRILDPLNRVRLINQDTILNRATQFGTYVSLIPYTPWVIGLTLEGFRYPLTDYEMSSYYCDGSSHLSGISNEICQEQASIHLKEGILVLVESKDE